VTALALAASAPPGLGEAAPVAPTVSGVHEAEAPDPVAVGMTAAVGGAIGAAAGATVAGLATLFGVMGAQGAAADDPDAVRVRIYAGAAAATTGALLGGGVGAALGPTLVLGEPQTGPAVGGALGGAALAAADVFLAAWFCADGTTGQQLAYGTPLCVISPLCAAAGAAGGAALGAGFVRRPEAPPPVPSLSVAPSSDTVSAPAPAPAAPPGT
jgi:hypothetical protein